MNHGKRHRIARFSASAMLTLSCAIAVLLQGCGSSGGSLDPAAVRAAIGETLDEERQLVQSTIDDSERQESFLKLIDQRNAVLRNHVADIKQYRADFEALNANYYATREDLELLVAQYNGQREMTQKDLVQLQGAMKSTTTFAEWQIIAEFQKEELNPRDLAYGGGLAEEN